MSRDVGWSNDHQRDYLNKKALRQFSSPRRRFLPVLVLAVIVALVLVALIIIPVVT